MGLLVDAAWALDLERVRELLAQGHNINERDWRNKTPLHMAVYRGDIELIRYLVKQGANLEAKDNRGWTALRHSIYQGEFEIFDILLSSGTDVSFRYTGGDTVLHLIVLLDHGPTWINYLFDTIDVDPRTLFSVKDDDGDTPLHCLKSLASANCLVEYGFDSSTSGLQSTWMCPTLLSIRNKQGQTPYEEATTQKERRNVVEKYLDSFESLPLADLATMKLSPGLNDFQRFLARRIYYTILCKLPSGPDLGRRIMAFLAPADVMK